MTQNFMGLFVCAKQNIYVANNKNVAILTSTCRARVMKYSEFYRWLKQQGVMFEPGKGSHQIVRYNARTSVFAFHGSKG